MTEEMEKRELEFCRELAKRCMPGLRDDSDRLAWEHAEDVARAVQEREWVHPDGWSFWVCVAWLHDVIEDCDDMDEARLAQELESAGSFQSRAQEMARMVQVLSKRKGEGPGYFQRIKECGHWQLSLIKVLDRLANLREGRRAFKRKRWLAYVKETEEHILPLLANVDEGLRVPLLLSLTTAMVGGPGR